MSSTRLPGKVLNDLAGKPMLQWVIDAAVDSELIDGVVVATSTMASDLPIVEYCYKQKIYCTTGQLDDVLARFYQTAVEWRATHIVRLTADCPLLTGGVIDEVVSQYLYTENSFLINYAYLLNNVDGLDVEVFSYQRLLLAHKLATSQEEREHVTLFIRKHSNGGFSIKVDSDDVDTPFSVNTSEEFERMAGILGGI